VTYRAFRADIPDRDAHVVLEEQFEGCYVLLFEGDAPLMSRDDLYNDVEEAKAFCARDHNTDRDSWQQLENHRFWMET
jgi:hypothetical protein